MVAKRLAVEIRTPPTSEKRSKNRFGVEKQPDCHSLKIQEPGGIVMCTARGNLPGRDFRFADPGGIVCRDNVMDVMKAYRSHPCVGIEEEQWYRSGLQSYPAGFISAFIETVSGEIPGARFAYSQAVRIHCHNVFLSSRGKNNVPLHDTTRLVWTSAHLAHYHNCTKLYSIASSHRQREGKSL